MQGWSLPLVGKPLDEYTDEEWEAEKLQARADHEAMVAAQKPLSFEDKLNILAQQYQPEFNTDVTADQILTGIFAPTDLTFDEYLTLVYECAADIYDNHSDCGKVTPMGSARLSRFLQWALLQEPEWCIFAFRFVTHTKRVWLTREQDNALDEFSTRYSGILLDALKRSK